jgi:SNF2 family DNA or RNA helicase
MHLPEFLKNYESIAKHYLAVGRVRDIEFSRGTYQIQVIDAKTEEEFWAFFQFDAEDQVKDCFCSCSLHGKDSHCEHIAAAYLKIYNWHNSPLHKRFENSLWNSLCKLYSDLLGCSINILIKLHPGSYICRSEGGARLFSIEGKIPRLNQQLKSILEYRVKESEETSLKFSNLSPEEISLWREGRPGTELGYELSFWCDLAKSLMLLQESCQPYTISFQESEKGIPNSITINFQEVSVYFFLPESDLPKIIPALSSVNSPLKIQSFEERAIASIEYNKQKKILTLQHRQFEKRDAVSLKQTEIDGWIYAKGDGFYAKQHNPLLSQSIFEGEAISHLLDTQFDLVKKHLTKFELHEEHAVASYRLFFDDKWDLHINCYLFEPGDLTSGSSAFFGDWAFLDRKGKKGGFYRLHGIKFQELDKTIPCDEVADFIRKEKVWLNDREGFSPHLASIESQLIFSLEKQHLIFENRIEKMEEAAAHKEFGNWVYIAGQGFYAKSSLFTGLLAISEIKIKRDQIPSFIRSKRQELQFVSGFFSSFCPIAKVRLRIEVADDGLRIKIRPDYEVLPEYKDEKLEYFEDFIYTPKEGFSQIPPESRIPEKFWSPLELDAAECNQFLTSDLENLKPLISWIDPRLIKPEHLQLQLEQIQQNEGRIEVSTGMNYRSEKGKIDLYSVWKGLSKKQRYLFTSAGLIDLENERFKWVRGLKKEQFQEDKKLSLSNLELLKINAFERLSEETEGSVPEVLKNILEFKTPDDPTLEGFKSELRSYQEIGLKWLWFLYHHKLSGILCDDMGLGKTHQAMALMAAIDAWMNKKEPSANKKKFLVICPTSVLYHWEEKLNQFLPEMRLAIFHGSSRDWAELEKEYDILLTSYGIWRNECEKLKFISFEAAFFDELQVAKNASSLIHSSLLKVKATMRIGLTGTPIENHLRELKSLFDIVLPSYMPSETEYKDFFLKPIERYQDQERKQLLSRFIKPFMLRRKKADVLLDLPEKIEEVAYCELSLKQKELYQAALERSGTSIIKELEDSDSPIPFIHVFSLLSHLKQICNHPALYLKDLPNYKNYPSGKWELFLELLSEARESGQKVVVFSHYLGMLDIMESYLEQEGIGFASVRGSTVDRKGELLRFQNDPRCEIFLGSLQAVGLGVDLTSASVVIHYDRWWNAARENQATDRVYRIGQLRGVQVFKLVSKNSFEETIDALIAKKSRLMEEIVGVDDYQIVKQFSRSEIMQLLKNLPQ